MSTNTSELWKGEKARVDHEAIKAALRKFYQIHNPSRLSSIDTIMESYAGKEIVLLEELKRRYKVDEFEHFDKIISELSAVAESLPSAPKDGGLTSADNAPVTESVPPSTPMSDSVGAEQQAPSKGVITLQDTISATARASVALGIQSLPSIFTEKIIPAKWKAFSTDPVSAGETDAAAKRPEPAAEAAESNPDIVAYLQAGAHPQELIAELQHSAETLARMDKQLKQTLRRMDMRSPDVPMEKLESLGGRSEQSLVQEVVALRDLVDDLRGFIIENYADKSVTKFHAAGAGAAQESQGVSDVQVDGSEQISAENATAEADTTNNQTSSDANETAIAESKIEQASKVDDWTDKLKRLAPDWLQLDTLRRHIEEVSRDKDAVKHQLLLAQQQLLEKDALLSSLQDRVAHLEQDIEMSQRVKIDFISHTEEKIRVMEQRHRDHLLHLQERCLFEHEDALSHLADVAETQQNWQAALSKEAQAEIVRLRVELAKSRRVEAQRDREVAFLQRQLTEAAKQLAQYVVESEASDIQQG